MGDLNIDNYDKEGALDEIYQEKQSAQQEMIDKVRVEIDQDRFNLLTEDVFSHE